MKLLTISTARRSRIQVAVRSRNRLAIRSLIVGLLAFVIVSYGFRRWAESNAAFCDPVYAVKEAKWLAKLRTASTPVIVVLGSSRVSYGFDAGRIDEWSRGRIRAINFGMPRSGPVSQTLSVRRLLAHERPVPLVYLEVLARLIQESPLPEELKWLPQDRLSKPERRDSLDRGWYRRGETPSNPLTTFFDFRSKCLARTAPWMNSPRETIGWDDSCDVHGWEPFLLSAPTVEQRSRASETARKEYEAVLANFKPGGPAFETLRESVALLQRRNIPVRLLLMPESTRFRSWYGPGANERLLDALRSLDVPMVDARSWVSDGEFLDGHHLLLSGAATFIEKFIAAERNALERETLP